MRAYQRPWIQAKATQRRALSREHDILNWFQDIRRFVPVVERRCDTCAIDLVGRPGIIFQGTILCYTHAKARWVREFEQILDTQAVAHAARQAWFSAEDKSVENLRLARRLIPKSILISTVAAALWHGTCWPLPFGLTAWLIARSVLRKFLRDSRRRFRATHPMPPVSPLESLTPEMYDPELLIVDWVNEPPIVDYRNAILKRDKSTCQCCGATGPGVNLEVHHVIPRRRHGPDVAENLVTLCISCHWKESWFGHVHKAAREAAT